jgi:hypothetical protein
LSSCRTQGLVVPDVADEPRDVEIVDPDRVRAVAHHDAHIVAFADELAGDVRSEIAVRADDQ